MAQSDATQAQATAGSMRTFWMQKLGLATLQVVGVSQSDLQSLAKEMNSTTVQSKLEEHRQHWIHQPRDVENKRDTALLDARCADSGLKALQGLHAEALGICDELLSNQTEHGSVSTESKIQVTGVKGLVHALKGEWQAAQHFLVGSMTQGLEHFISSEGNGDFFLDYVVFTLGEALGYLLIHVGESDGSTRDSLQSSANEDHCDKSHALYPVMLLGLGLLGEGAKFEETNYNIERLMDFAKQVSQRQFGDSPCLCSCAHEKVAMVLNESKYKDKEHMAMADSFRLAKSIHLAQSAGKSPHLESSCLNSSGNLGTEGGNPFLSLKTNSSALRLKLSMCDESEADPEVQFFCQQLLENISEFLALEGKDVPRPLANAHPADVLVYSLCVIAFLEKDRKLEALEEVAEGVSRFQHVISNAVWMSDNLSQLTNEYLKRGAYRKAAAICFLRSNFSTNLSEKLELRSFLNKAGELGMALEGIKVVTSESMQLDESQWRLRASLYMSAAALFDSSGETDAAIGAREEACRIVCTHATSYEFTDCRVDLELINGMIFLLQSYKRQRNWSAAYKIFNTMDTHIGKYYYNKPVGKDWHDTKYNIASQRGDYDIASKILLSYPFINDNIDIRSSIILELRKKEQLMRKFASRGRIEKAIEKTEEMLESIQKLPSPRDKLVEEIAVRNKRCSLFSRMGKQTHALEEMEKVIAAINLVEYQDVRESVRLEFVLCLCFLAIDCYKNGKAIETKRLMGFAERKVSKCNNVLELAEVEFLEVRMLDHDGKWEEAADKARPLILLFMEEQRRLCHLDHEPKSWLSFSQDYINEKLRFIESLYLRRLREPINGLVWAERSQQRFFMHQIYNRPKEIAIPNPSDLDECDQSLTILIIQTIKALRTKTFIVEYSYNPDKKIINMYVVAMTPDGNDFFRSGKICFLPKWFEENGQPSNKSLEELIANAIDEQERDAIDERDQSIEALSTLHALLIQYIEEDLKGCDSLIFVPGHGLLAQIPFAALYDARHSKHLIADFNVAVVPSIVTLHRCLYRQFNFESSKSQVLGPNLLKDSSLEPGPSEQSQTLQFEGHLPSHNVAFIAGNPKPMACGLHQLVGAEEEARNVAAFFKVTPCVGKDMTKQAVIEGLSTSKVVLLATHGVVDDDYPHGCLVLQASPGSNEVIPTSPLQPESDKPLRCMPDEAVASTLTASTATPIEVSLSSVTAELSKGKGIAKQNVPLQHDGRQEGEQFNSTRLFEFSDAKTKQKRAEEASQVLTAEEIVALEGGIRAGLVVLSACQSGLGEATPGEGLLGLGRALLLAGAVSTILTLWEVNDVITSRFIIDLFKELLIAEPRGRSVDECMRKVMLNMIREGQPLKHWAAFMIVGSPALRLWKPDNSTWGVSGFDKHSYHAFGVANYCPHSCRVCEKRKEVSNSERSTTIYDVSNTVDTESTHTLDDKELEEMLRKGARLKRLGETTLFTLTHQDGSFEYLSLGAEIEVVKPPFE